MLTKNKIEGNSTLVASYTLKSSSLLIQSLAKGYGQLLTEATCAYSISLRVQVSLRSHRLNARNTRTVLTVQVRPCSHQLEQDC